MGAYFYSLDRFRPKLNLLKSFQCFELNLPKMNSFQPRLTRKLCLKNLKSHLGLNQVLILNQRLVRLNVTIRGKSNCALLTMRSTHACRESQCENAGENVNGPGTKI